LRGKHHPRFGPSAKEAPVTTRSAHDVSLGSNKVRGCCKSHSKILGLPWGYYGIKRDLSSKFSSSSPFGKSLQHHRNNFVSHIAVGIIHHEASKKLRFAANSTIFSANVPTMWRRYTTKRQAFVKVIFKS